MAAILFPPSFLCRKFTPAPWAGPGFQGLLHRFFVTRLVAVHLSRLFQRFTAQFACPCLLWFLFSLLLLFIPFCPACHAAIAPGPFFGKTPPAIGTFPHWLLLFPTFFPRLAGMILYPALITAKTPVSPFPFFLFDPIPAFRTYLRRFLIISFGIIALNPARIAAIFSR